MRMLRWRSCCEWRDAYGDRDARCMEIRMREAVSHDDDALPPSKSQTLDAGST